jgi:hypothetical protein
MDFPLLSFLAHRITSQHMNDIKEEIKRSEIIYIIGKNYRSVAYRNASC